MFQTKQAEKDIMDGQFPETPQGNETTATATTIKVSTTFLDNNEVKTPPLQKQFFESLAKKVTDRVFETIGEQETADVNVVILVNEFSLLHCIDCQHLARCKHQMLGLFR